MVIVFTAVRIRVAKLGRGEIVGNIGDQCGHGMVGNGKM